MLPSATSLGAQLHALGYERWSEALAGPLGDALAPGRHGDRPRWERALHALPAVTLSHCDLTAAAPALHSNAPLSIPTEAALREALLGLSPWRKGPFNFFGISVDAEWRSDLKWARLAPHLSFQGHI